MLAPLAYSFLFFFQRSGAHRDLHSFPTRRSSDLLGEGDEFGELGTFFNEVSEQLSADRSQMAGQVANSCSLTSLKRSEEHTSELQSHVNLVCRLLLEKKKKKKKKQIKYHEKPTQH